MGVEPITVTDLYRSGEVWCIAGENFSPYCRVYADGEELETVYLSSALLCLKQDPGELRPADLEIRVVDQDGTRLSPEE